MGFFFRKKKKKERELDAAFARIAGEFENIDNRNDRKKRQHLIIESCEQIIDTTKEIEEQKAERRVLSGCLDDIKKLQGLPEKESREILEAAGNIIKLDAAKKNYLSSDRKIDEERFAFFQEQQDNLVPAIRKMQGNETYQKALKRDMNVLEGEKSQWQILREDILAEERILKKLILGIFIFFGIMIGVFVLFDEVYNMDMTWSWIALLFFVLASSVGIYLRLHIDERDLKQSEVNYNYAVDLLNKVKAKYVSVTNALDYTYEKFDVHSSQDLNYHWERYVETVREDEKYARNNEDYEFFTARLSRLLDKLGLNDKKMWMSQVKSLVNPEEMEKVKNELTQRMEKITESIEYNTTLVRNERNQIDKMIKQEGNYFPEIQEIIDSIDRLCASKF